MTIIEFIQTQYPIRDKVKGRLEDPYKKIANDDDLPYDVIGPDDNGVVTKLVEVEENRYISVMDLISMSEEEVNRTGDQPLITVWRAYMEQIDLEDMNLLDIMESVRRYGDVVKKREEQFGVLSL